MRIIHVLAGLCLVGIASATLAAEPSPYAGQQARAIKALSPSETADLLAGRGMGMAKAAELNGYPGPVHVLDMAADLKLSPQQVAAIIAIRDKMSAAAKPLGIEIVRRERALNAQFADGTIGGRDLTQETQSLGDLYGKLRSVHLSAHIAVKAVLKPGQIVQYQRLRGYLIASGTASPDTAMPQGMHNHGN